MNEKPKIYKCKTQHKLVTKLRDDFKSGGNDFIILYAYNGTGKTRLSMEFKESGKLKSETKRDTLYFNAFTEDLFHWDNDLESDTTRTLQINNKSHFFDGIKELALEEKIFEYLERYANFNFKIDYDNWRVSFSRGEEDHIKVSRGEENIFIWCFFLAVAQLIIEDNKAYSWVKYLYIDDPISSLDDNNAITVAHDLANLLKKSKDKVKSIISSHHSLFFNIMCNELKTCNNYSCKKYFLHHTKNTDEYILHPTNDTPFFYHIAILNELQKSIKSGKLYVYHFNMLRNVLEKTATFFGFKDFSYCIKGIKDEALYARAVNLLSHGKYSLYEPKEMVEDNKKLFENILGSFLERYKFDLSELH